MADCPICNSVLQTVEFRPFCSRRCTQVDLGRWLTGSYTIADTASPDEEDPLDLSDDLG